MSTANNVRTRSTISYCVLPTIRPERMVAFFDAWNGGYLSDNFVLVEDNPTKSDFSKVPEDFRKNHYAWDDIDRICGKHAWIFSRRDSAIRAFGFLVAWHKGAQSVLTVDDDVYPHAGFENLYYHHVKNRSTQTRWVPSAGVRTRGLPYRNLGHLKDVHASVGLWTEAGDPDAIEALTKIARGDAEPFQPSPGVRLVPHGQYVPVCGMNLFFSKAALPFFYFPLMGEGQPYRRMDDIFCGILAKKMFDHLGWHMVVGEPFVVHSRASDPFVNLVKEAPGIAANETFWEAVDAVKLTNTEPIKVVRDMGSGLVGHKDPYIANLGKALGVWADLLATKPAGL